MLDLLTVGPKFTRPTCRVAAGKRLDGDRCRLIAGTRYPQPAPELSSKPHVAAAVDRWERQTDRQTDGLTLDRFKTLPHTMRTAYSNLVTIRRRQ